MLRNALREELAAVLTPPAGGRPPAIRRSPREEWLYMTDLPVLYGGTVPNTLLTALTGLGWEYRQEDDRLQLRKPAPEPPEHWYAGPFGPEAGCCLSLLDRHPQRDVEDSGAAQRTLIKAGEEGEKAYEETCAALHKDWARRLREGKSLPALSRRYFRI